MNTYKTSLYGSVCEKRMIRVKTRIEVWTDRDHKWNNAAIGIGEKESFTFELDLKVFGIAHIDHRQTVVYTADCHSKTNSLFIGWTSLVIFLFCDRFYCLLWCFILNLVFFFFVYIITYIRTSTVAPLCPCIIFIVRTAANTHIYMRRSHV